MCAIRGWVAVKKVVVGAVVGVPLMTVERGLAADNVMLTKTPPAAAPAAYDWSGFYVGGHAGYAFGGSNWSSTQVSGAAPGLSGSLDFTNAYNLSTGNGSYFLGFQGGYDTMTASRWLFGVQADISIPSFVGGNQTLATAPTGTVNDLERDE